MTNRAQYLTLAALSILASVSVFASGSLVFSVIADEVESGMPVSLFLPLIIASPFILLALRFFRKAASERASAQIPVQ